MKRLYSVIVSLMFCSTISFAGYLHQDAAGNWLSTDDNGATTRVTQTANGNFVASNNQGTTYYNQGADASSLVSSFQSNTTTPSYSLPQSTGTAVSSRNPMAYYQLGLNGGQAQAGPWAMSSNNLLQMAMAQAQLRAQQEQAQEEAQQQEQARQAENQREQAEVLENNKKFVLEKYPELNNPNSDIYKRYKKIMEEHPEYLSPADGPILVMHAMEEEINAEKQNSRDSEDDQHAKDQLITYWYSLLGPTFKSQHTLEDFQKKVSSYSYKELKQHFEEFKKDVQNYNNYMK